MIREGLFEDLGLRPSDVDRYAAVLTRIFTPLEMRPTRKAPVRTRRRWPSAGRGTAFEMAESDLVMPHLGAGRFGADYDTPNGAVVDLGQFSYRP